MKFDGEDDALCMCSYSDENELDKFKCILICKEKSSICIRTTEDSDEGKINDHCIINITQSIDSI